VSLVGPDEVLSFEEIVKLVQVANELGVTKVRLTGGEPLVRRGIEELVRMLSESCELEDLALTTNGSLLEEYAPALKEGGLRRVNVSLDTLKPERFREITRGGELERVWRGIERALTVGLSPVKLNVVVMQGFNEDELVELARLTEELELTVRFIELMPIGEANGEFFSAHYLSMAEAKRRLEEEFELLSADGGRGSGPARYFRIKGAEGKIGLISPLTESYCSSCNRLRLTARGELRPCLAWDRNIPVRESLRSGDHRLVKERLLQAIREKPRGHRWDRGMVTSDAIGAIGG
jgi:cyclic pyranopterin phosphate synthase